MQKLPKMIFAVMLYYIALALGLTLLIIPGFILMMSLSFFGYFIIFEGSTAYQSLKASHKLIWKDWWRTAGVFTVPSILIVILFAAFGTVVGLMGMDEDSINNLNLVMNLLSGLYMPYFLVLGYVQYHDLKLRKSGSDLEARLAE